MVEKDQTLEALATIRMCIDDNDTAIEHEKFQATDDGDFVNSDDYDGSDEQFAPGTHWTLGAPKSLAHISEIQRNKFPTFEAQMCQCLAQLSPEDFNSDGFIPVKVCAFQSVFSLR